MSPHPPFIMPLTRTLVRVHTNLICNTWTQVRNKLLLTHNIRII